MRHLSILIALLLLSTLTLHAGRRTSEQALQIAQQLQARHAPAYHHKRAVATEAVVAEANDTYYAINTANGFVLVGADDRMPEVLGYSDSSLYDSDNLPPAFRYWMRNYEAESQRLGEATTAPVYSYTDVCPPLVTSHWDQDAPYNNLAPKCSSQERTVAGCAATAVAQIMHRHKSPARGTGSESYYWTCVENDNYSQQITVNYSSTTYDWSNMLDTYTHGYTSAQSKAVATLMYHLGVAMHMEFGGSNNGSGTTDYYALYALYAHFGYSKHIRTLVKEYYALHDLQQILHDELAEGRPILTTGADWTGGHAFVCDGYDADGLFHFNWGWGGVADGYYLITALNPTEQGIGGNALGTYNFLTTFYTGIRPAEGDQGTAYPQLGADSLSVSPRSASRASTLDVKLHGITNIGVFDIRNYKIGIALLNPENDEIVRVLDTENDDELGMGYSFHKALTLSFEIPYFISDGTYRICGAYKDNENDWMLMPCLGGWWYKNLTINNGIITISEIDRSHDFPTVNLQTGEMVHTHTAIHRNDTFSVTLNGIINPTDEKFTGYYGLGLYQGNDLCAVLKQTKGIQMLHASAMRDTLWTFNGVQISGTVQAGEYTIRPMAQVLYQDWQPMTKQDGSVVDIPVSVQAKSVWFREIELPVPVSFKADSVRANNAHLYFTIPASVHKFTCDIGLRITRNDFVYEEHLSNVEIGGPYEYNYSPIFPAQEQMRRNQSYRATLLWRLNSEDDWHTFLPEGYGSTVFYLYDPELSEGLTDEKADDETREPHGRKILHNGQIIIWRGGKSYNILGNILQP